MSDFNLSESDCLYDFFESLIIAVTLLRNCLNVVQCLSSFVNLAVRYALLRFLIYLLIKVVIHGGSDGRIVTVLLGIHDSASVSI